MKKALLTWNMRLSAVASGFTLFYAGFQIGRYRYGTQQFFPPRTGAAFLIFVAICLSWLWIGIALRKEGRSDMHYCVPPAAVLLFSGVIEVITLISDIKDTVFGKNFLICGSAVFLLSLLLAISNFACAVITKRECRKAWEDKQSE